MPDIASLKSGVWAARPKPGIYHFVFCRDLDAISRKQGMKGGSVLAHVTDWNDDADEESAPKGAQKNTPKGLSPKESRNFGRFS